MAIQNENQANSSIWNALDERLGLSGLAYPVPEHANALPYFLGGITLAGFVILVATGIIMAQFYHPHPANAHDSVIYIITEAPFGDFIRSLHFWAANVVVITAILHLIQVFVSGSFKRPREVNWLVGLGLLALTFAFVFTGTVLKWDQEGVEALAHNREIGEILGSFGTWFTGELTISVPLLTRFNLAHVSLLVVLLVVFVLFHLYLIKQHGVSAKATVDATSGSMTIEHGGSRFSIHLQN